MPYKPRARGAIPPYGKNFRREDAPWHPIYATTIYVLKIDRYWYIRSDHTSHRWQIFCTFGTMSDFPVSQPQRTLTEAMNLLLSGIASGYYTIATP